MFRPVVGNLELISPDKHGNGRRSGCFLRVSLNGPQVTGPMLPEDLRRGEDGEEDPCPISG